MSGYEPSGNRPAIILAGVCLSGKTSLARELAALASLPVEFVEGDALHEPRNIEKMRKGRALTEADRRAWKKRVAGSIAGRPPGVLRMISCSALKRAFRDDLRAGGDLRFIFLLLDKEEARRRAARRLREAPEHFFQPARFPALLEGQYRDLEIPGPDERDCLLVDAGKGRDPGALAMEIARRLRLPWIDSGGGDSLP